jgi:hypothetical protein
MRPITFPQIVLALSLLALTGCASIAGATPTASPASPTHAVPAEVDVCNRLDKDAVARIMERDLVKTAALPYAEPFGAGCQYIFGLDSSGTVVYANLFVTSELSYDKIQLMSASVTPLKGLGDDAYTAVRPDGPQLWVLVKGRGAGGVAIGGAWSVERAKALADLLIDLLNSI